MKMINVDMNNKVINNNINTEKAFYMPAEFDKLAGKSRFMAVWRS